MSKIRKANTIVLLERRLAEVENAAALDPMELIGLQDEFQRVENKWREQIAAGSERRREGDPEKLDRWFERLQRQIERVLRAAPSAPEAAYLRGALQKIIGRSS